MTAMLTRTEVRKNITPNYLNGKNGHTNDKKNSRAIEHFGANTFNDHVMRDKLPKEVYRKLQNTIKKGAHLEEDIANSVAHAMKEWAQEKGVTHFTHWFHPMTGLTAEKHDSFLDIDYDGQPVERFSGDKLIQGEPDASSFPSGGMRSTFEARGYTMWDPSSPAFIMDGPHGGILCIPSVFISYNGEALDKKTPLLRSMRALDEAARKILALFGKSIERVTATLGPEQEYFLVDKNLYTQRPDLILAGRTLIGAMPPKGQEMEDHYFGSIKERVLEFMQLAEKELYKLGIPAKTRHNEVAPHQYELAPIFCEANVAADRNQLVMETLKKVATRLDLALLLHEKPFAGVNGSGKHVNWSIVDNEGNNLLDPGSTPEENLQFLVVLVAVMRAVHKYADLLRASIASAGNDHRLGANEAPPAIMSVFLGATLSKILDSIETGNTEQVSEKKIIDLGISNLPQILQDNTDRNRTSPFAFTGNKFEFRAVGSSASISLPATILNAAVADSLEFFHDAIADEMRKKKDIKSACFAVLKNEIVATKPVRFEGNNYAEEWVVDAEKRGLPNLRHTVDALKALRKAENIAMLSKHRVYSEAELASRYHTKLEQFCKTISIEADTLESIAKTMVLPAAISYQNSLIEAVRGLKELAEMIQAPEAVHEQTNLLSTVAKEIAALRKALGRLAECEVRTEKI
ncbi:MAG: glutamine synthetase III, partial [bacterium]